MPTLKTIVLHKQVVFHFYVMCLSKGIGLMRDPFPSIAWPALVLQADTQMNDIGEFSVGVFLLGTNN